MNPTIFKIASTYKNQSTKFSRFRFDITNLVIWGKTRKGARRWYVMETTRIGTVSIFGISPTNLCRNPIACICYVSNVVQIGSEVVISNSKNWTVKWCINAPYDSFKLSLFGTNNKSLLPITWFIHIGEPTRTRKKDSFYEQFNLLLFWVFRWGYKARLY